MVRTERQWNSEFGIFKLSAYLSLLLFIDVFADHRLANLFRLLLGDFIVFGRRGRRSSIVHFVVVVVGRMSAIVHPVENAMKSVKSGRFSTIRWNSSSRENADSSSVH
jgi:hypothetical protein